MSLFGQGLRRRARKSREIQYLDVTALVDVVFFLLFFFLLTFNLNRPEGFTLAMPKAKAAGKVKDTGIRVLIPVRGEYRVKDDRFDDEGLKAFLAEKVQQNPSVVVHLVADHKAASQRLVTALELTTAARVKNALLRTEPTGQ